MSNSNIFERNKKRTRRPLSLRMTSAFVVLSFLFQEIVLANPGLKPIEWNSIQRPKIDFQLPEPIASIEDATLLNISAMKSDMALEVKEIRAALGHALPAGSLGVITDNLKFNAQVRVLIEQILRAHRDPVYKNDIFFLTGADSLSESRRGVVEELINLANAAIGGNFIQMKDPDGFEGVVVQYVITDGMEKLPSKDGRTVMMPISGLEADALLGWYEAIRMGGVLGGVFAGHFDGSKIDFDRISADDIPQAALDFYNSRAVNRIASRVFLRDLLKGQVSIDQLKEFSFFLPLAQRVPVEVLMQGARLVLRAVGVAA